MALRNNSWRGVGCAMSVIAWLAIGAARTTAEEKKPAAEQPEREGIKILFSEEGERGGGYWIGIYPQTIDKELAERLHAKPGHGVLVNQVMPESPATKAGLIEDDILLAAGNRELSDVGQLADIVRGSHGKTIPLKVRRGEKVLDLEVTPAKAGEGHKMLFWQGKREGAAGEEAEAREKLEGMLRQIRENQIQRHKEAPVEPRAGGGVIYRAQPGMPGSPLPSGSPAELPEEMQVTIQKRGNQLARVTVTVGDKKWQTNEHELHILPPPAIAYVSRVLGRPMMPDRGGFAVVRGPNGETPQRFEIRIGENGQAQVVGPQQAAKPAIQATPQGIRIELKEEGESKERGPERGPIKWQELRRPDRAQAKPEKDPRDAALQELQEQVRKLERALDELSQEKAKPQKKRKKKGDE